MLLSGSIKLTTEVRVPPSRLALTSGDPDGIGSEVALKALAELGPQHGHQIVLWRSQSCPKSHLDFVDGVFKRKTFSSYEQYIDSQMAFDPQHLIDICSEESAAHWVVESTQACLKNELQALVTGPLSKTLICQSGLREIGHTGLFKSICKTDDLFMGFLGNHFNVVLVTDHIPLAEVPASLSLSKFQRALQISHQWWTLSKSRESSTTVKPIALVGLNPHAGEQGLLGSEEKDLYEDLLNWAQSQAIPTEGPLVPDSAFRPENWDRYSLYLCPYHDQGLIPFKMAHADHRSAHITLGLPFLRLSVDHGTGKDIFNQNKASHLSMLTALKRALEMTRPKGASSL